MKFYSRYLQVYDCILVPCYTVSYFIGVIWWNHKTEERRVKYREGLVDILVWCAPVLCDTYTGWPQTWKTWKTWKTQGIWKIVNISGKTQGKWKICDMIANKNALSEFFSFELPSLSCESFSFELLREKLEISWKTQGKLREFSFSKMWSPWYNSMSGRCSWLIRL